MEHMELRPLWMCDVCYEAPMERTSIEGLRSLLVLKNTQQKGLNPWKSRVRETQLEPMPYCEFTNNEDLLNTPYFHEIQLELKPYCGFLNHKDPGRAFY